MQNGRQRTRDEDQAQSAAQNNCQSARFHDSCPSMDPVFTRIIPGPAIHKIRFQQNFVAGDATMDLNGISLFLRVVETGSFTKAADELDMTTSGVSRALDLAVRVGRLSDSSLIARRVGSLVTGLFASREYVARNGQPRRPADLTRHNCVLFRGQGGKATWLLRDGKREYPVEVTGSLEVDDIPSIHQAVTANIGIGIVSFFSSSRIEGLVRILPRYISGELPISLVSPSKRLEPARVVLFRDFLAAKLSALPWRG
jgi:DNA-binding transcriptional LysR family regulator